MTLTKKVIGQWAGVLAVVLVFCTVLSHVINQKLLPVVETVSPARNILKTEITAKADVENEMQYEEEQAPVDWTVKQVYVKKGDNVQKGTPLFQIDVLELKERIKTLEADIQEQKNNINAYDWTGGDRLVLEMKLEADEMEYQRLIQTKIPENGVITSTTDGVISEFSLKSGDVLKAYETYVQYEQSASEQYIKWDLSEEAGSLYHDVQTAELAITRAADKSDNNETVELNIEKKEQTDDGDWTYYAKIPDELTFDSGDTFRITMLLKENTYDYVVPRSCIQEDSSGRTYIYVLEEEEGIFSKEYRVSQKFISVIDEDNLHAAIMPEQGGETLTGCKVVSSTSKALESGCEVALLEVS